MGDWNKGESADRMRNLFETGKTQSHFGQRHRFEYRPAHPYLRGNRSPVSCRGVTSLTARVAWRHDETSIDPARLAGVGAAAGNEDGPPRSSHWIRMKRHRQRDGRILVVLIIAGLLSCLVSACPCQAAEDLPSASDVLRRMLERAQAVARDEQGIHYAYEKRSLLAHLDAAGQTVKSEEKLYEVTLVAGYPFNRLVKIGGRELTPEELKRQQRKEERFRQRFTSHNLTNMAARKEAWLTPQLLERYDFAVKERVVLNDRPVLVLTFSPKKGELPENAIADRILNRMAGTVWIDEQDAEAAKLSVNLTDSLSLGWFGMLGSVSRCDLNLERQRMPEGVWVNARQIFQIQCRKLTSTLRFRSTEESRGFRRVAAPR